MFQPVLTFESSAPGGTVRAKVKVQLEPPASVIPPSGATVHVELLCENTAPALPPEACEAVKLCEALLRLSIVTVRWTGEPGVATPKSSSGVLTASASARIAVAAM